MTGAHWTAGLHHDGSALYVSNPLPALGETVTIRLRAPRSAPITGVRLRSAPDGERHFDEMRRVPTDNNCVYYESEFVVSMPRNHYRFHIAAADGVYYLNALGLSRALSPDALDFKLLADFEAPAWINDAIFYQIFPDRFFNGDHTLNHAPGAWRHGKFSVQLREWDAPPLPYHTGGNLDFYGGDLPGIQQKIDYLLRLGVNAIYLNPLFVSSSNHRYNIMDFHTVDPHLGGNDALVKLARALRDAGIKLMLDVTPNHTSSEHPWFVDAQKDPAAPTAEFYTFYDHPNRYESWFGIAALPKLNYESQALRDAMYRDDQSVLLRWLRPPYQIDGWRLDVFNMTARQGGVQLNHKVAREIRKSVKSTNPEAFLIGEHFFDSTPHLQGDEMDAMMNYTGFNLPLWRWLTGYALGDNFMAQSGAAEPMPTDAFAEQLANFRAAVPWVIARMQFHQLDSHDTRRIFNICNGDIALVKLGLALLMTYPGTPCLYYGTEIGLAGEGDPDNRRTMSWDENEWSMDLFDWCQRLIALRKSAPALTEGGFQQIYAHEDIWAFQRQNENQRLVIVAYRGDQPIALQKLPVWQTSVPDGASARDLLSDRRFKVEDGDLRLTNLTPRDALIMELD